MKFLGFAQPRASVQANRVPGGNQFVTIAATPARGDMYKARTSETNPRLFILLRFYRSAGSRLRACSPRHHP